MQCYEGELMRAHLRQCARRAGRPRVADDLALLEALDERGVHTLTALLALSPAELDSLVRRVTEDPLLAA